MFTADENGVYARVSASGPRRLFAYAVLLALGGVLIYAPIASPPSFFWTLFMFTLGAATFVLAERMRRATRLALLLTETDLRDESGRVLAQMDEIQQVSRGAFAMKPSNGFTLLLREPQSRAWAPGVWWRLGRRVGVGGVTSAGAAKFMAEQIALRLASKGS